MARKKKTDPADELDQLEESFASLTGRKIPKRQRPLRGLGFLLLLLILLALALWQLGQLPL